jgi:hypothetical protein
LLGAARALTRGDHLYMRYKCFVTLATMLTCLAVQGRAAAQDCDWDKITAAVEHLRSIRTNDALYSEVFNCILDAKLTEADCNEMKFKTEMLYLIFERDNEYHIECEEQEGDDNAAAEIGIDRIHVRLDPGFTHEQSAQRVASVIMHEIMHNFGHTHESADFNRAEYDLTVPEQAEACIRYGHPNAAPNDWIDRANCCEEQGTQAFCKDGVCYYVTEPLCVDASFDLNGSPPAYCGKMFRRQAGEVLSQTEHPFALTCTRYVGGDGTPPPF